MVKRIAALFLVLTVTTGTPAMAQGVGVVISAIGGWTVSEGVKGKDFVAGNGQTYNRADPADSGHFGLSIGAAEGHGEYGFLYRRQFTQLQVSGTTTTTIGDMATDNYHGYFAYNFGDPEGKVHFFVNAGAGMSHFSKVNFTTAGGSQASVGGRSEFSATFGAGVRTMMNDRFGLRFGVQFTPIYLTESPDSTWCDPYWGCYVVGNPQYASQIEAYGGVTFRFGGK